MTDFGLAASVQELGAVVEVVGAPVGLLAMSQAGPVALALAAELGATWWPGWCCSAPTLPDRRCSATRGCAGCWSTASALTGASAPRCWPSCTGPAPPTRPPGTWPGCCASLLAPRSPPATWRPSTGPTCWALLPRVNAPTLVLHYRGDRLVPFAGGQQLAAALAVATLVPLDGAYHLPDATDLPRIVDVIAGFVRSLHRR